MSDEQLDWFSAQVKAVVELGVKQGYVTQAEFDAAFVDLKRSSEIAVEPEVIEDVVAMLKEMGIEIIDEP